MKNKLLFAITAAAATVIVIAILCMETTPAAALIALPCMAWCSAFFSVNEDYFLKRGRYYGNCKT